METTQQENDITELRTLLFETIRNLKDGEKPMEIERAKAIADTAQVIINTAKVEIEYTKVTGAKTSTNFLPESTPLDNKTGGYVHKIGQRHG